MSSLAFSSTGCLQLMMNRDGSLKAEVAKLTANDVGQIPLDDLMAGSVSPTRAFSKRGASVEVSSEGSDRLCFQTKSRMINDARRGREEYATRLHSGDQGRFAVATYDSGDALKSAGWPAPNVNMSTVSIAEYRHVEQVQRTEHGKPMWYSDGKPKMTAPQVDVTIEFCTAAPKLTSSTRILALMSITSDGDNSLVVWKVEP